MVVNSFEVRAIAFKFASADEDSGETRTVEAGYLGAWEEGMGWGRFMLNL